MEKFLKTTFSKALYMDINPVIGALIVLSNASELGYILSKANLRRKMSSLMFLVSSVIVNILFGLNIIIVKIMDKELGTEMKNNIMALKTWRFFKGQMINIVLHVSILNILLVTFEKMLAVTAPFLLRRFTKKIRWLVLLLVWITSITGVALSYHYMKTYKSIIYLINVAGVLFSMVGQSIFFALILRSIYKSKQMSKQFDSQNKERSLTANEKRFISLVFKTYVCLFVFWTPYTVFALMRLTNSIGFDYDFSVYVHSTAFLNSLVSPLIFFYHHLKKSIYKRIKRLAQGKSPAESSTDPSSNQTGSTGITPKAVDSSDTPYNQPEDKTKDEETPEPVISPNRIVVEVATQGNPPDQLN
ncbi:tachykinin-like peptides receptor 86C [Clytia hemisphaerica]|uniref:tachykinin-like peptides receptor 86C n=1 Tax=Clytia hemisphaerica TaxID=252671 RepID=UPI0034D653D9